MIFLKDYPAAYIITGTKYANPDKVKEEFEALVNIAEENSCVDVLDRFVVQIYHGYML